MNTFASIIQWAFARLDNVGDYFSMLALRLLLGYEFWESGVMKFNGDNWFPQIQDQFPFPFSTVPTDISWFIATWSELIGVVALVIGLGTRFFSVSLIILTIVAWASVHAGNGFIVCDNVYKLPLIYVVMFVPLLLSGPGKLSLDHLIVKRFNVS